MYTTFNKSGMPKPNVDIPAGPKVYRQNPGALNSPNTPGGEVHQSAINRAGGSMLRPDLAGVR
jgi:hypothetical protein